MLPQFFLALFLSNTSISMLSMIGIIMLMGIATKTPFCWWNSHRVAPRRCRMRAKTRASDRMTTMAMGAGMLPVALDLGVGDGSFRSPMAIVVIGGLITSTFPSLLVIPVVYTYVDDFIDPGNRNCPVATSPKRCA